MVGDVKAAVAAAAGVFLALAPPVGADSHLLEPPDCGVILTNRAATFLVVEDALGWLGEWTVVDGRVTLAGDDLLPEGDYIAVWDDGTSEAFSQPWCDSTGPEDPPDPTEEPPGDPAPPDEQLPDPTPVAIPQPTIVLGRPLLVAL